MNTNKLKWKSQNKKEIEEYKKAIKLLGDSMIISVVDTVEFDMCLKQITAKNIYHHLKECFYNEIIESKEDLCKSFKQTSINWNDKYTYIDVDVEDIIINNMQPQPFPNDDLFTLNITAKFISKHIVKDPINLNKELQELYSKSPIVTVTDITNN